MEEIKLDVQLRDRLGSRKSRILRHTGYIPAVLYGGREEPVVIQVDRKAFERINRTHRGENVIYHLNVRKGDQVLQDYSAITKEVQYHPVLDHILHIDFNRISLTEKIEVKVAIKAKGEPIGVKQDGGSLEHVLWELTVVCLPTQIPQHIEVDVSGLKIHDTIHVKDLALPPGVVTQNDPEAVVLMVAAPMKEVEAPPPTPEGAPAAEPEVIKEKKKEVEEPQKASEAEPKAESKDKGKEAKA